MDSPTVRQKYNITDDDMDRLEELSEGCSRGSYWNDSYIFMLKKIDVQADALSGAEIAWLERILEVIQR
jgi:hypothetical protein